MAVHAHLRCEAVAWVDDHFPGWIDVTMTDADGRVWHFHDKAPMFDATGTTTRDAPFPCPAVIQVEILAEGDTVLVQARHVESAEGESVFRVRPDQLDR